MSEVYWVLDGQIPRPAVDREEWAAFFNDSQKRRVAETTTSNGYYVSTVFLGLDHSFGQSRLLLFETMAFPQEQGETLLDAREDLQWRYATWDEAVAGHEAAVYKIENDLEVPD